MSDDNHKQERIYDARNGSTALLGLLRGLPGELAGARTIAWQLFLREMRSQYRHSFLGYVWLLLPPLLLTAATLLAARSEVLNLGEIKVPAATFVLVGAMTWQIFAEAVAAPALAMAKARPLLARVAFPRESLILAKMLELALAMGIRLLLLVPLLLLLGISPQGSWLLIPLAWGGLIALGLSLGMPLAPLALISDDAGRGIAVLTMAGMFVTPVLFVPAEGSTMARLAAINPVTDLLALVRALVFQPGDADFPSVAMKIALAVVAGAVAWLVVRIAIPHALERMG